MRGTLPARRRPTGLSAPARRPRLVEDVSETPSNLPRPLTHFIGRRGETEAVIELLRVNRLVTLVGAGGIGKSRLALEVAQRSLPVFPGGVWWVELADVPAGADVVDRAVADAIGLRDQPGVGPADLLRQTLRQRRVLLVIDNCEHVIGAGARMLAPLLAACPDLVVLATSRQPLRVTGEVVHELGALGLDAGATGLTELLRQDAVALFVDRLRTQRRDVSIDEGAALVIRDLCRRLDNLPLAIELAAARARHFQLLELRDRLDDQPALLREGPRDAPERQKTLAATVDWSIGLLTPDARQFFRCLAVFLNGFDSLAAEAVWSTGRAAPVPDLLGELVDQSLVTVSDGPRGTTRYRLLEPVRQHVLARLRAADEEDAVRRRHARHYAAVARRFAEASAADEAHWLDALEIDHDNLRAALAWSIGNDGAQALQTATDLALFWERRGHGAEGREWLERVRVEVPAFESEPGATLALAWLRTADDDPAGGAELLRHALDQPVAADGSARARGLVLAAQLAHPDASRVRTALRDAVDVAAKAGSVELLCEVLGCAADQEWLIGDVQKAREDAFQALGTARRLRAPRLIFTPASVLARDATFAGTAGADTLWIDCLRAARELGDPALIHFALMMLSVRASQRGDLSGAVEFLAEGSPRRLPIPGELDQLHFIQHVALVLGRSGREAEGLRLIRAEQRFRGDRCCDSAAWQEYVQTESERLVAALGPRADEVQRDATFQSFDDALAEAERWVDELYAETRPARVDRAAPLSRRETEIARLTAAGLTNREIGQRLFISERTAEAHVQHILNKLSFANRAQIAAWVTRQS